MPVLRQLWPAYLLASILILYGIKWGLPQVPFTDQSWQADETAGVFMLHHIKFPLFNAGWFAWGTALFYQVWVLKELVTVGGLFHLSDSGLLLLGRVVVYLYAMGALTMTYLLGRDLFNARVGRAAALILAVSPGFVINAHYFKVEVPAVFWLLFAVWAALRLRAQPTSRAAAINGLIAGYAASTQYTAGVAVMAGLVTIAATDGIRPKLRFYKAFGLSAVIGFLVGTPYALLDPPAVLSGIHMDAVVNHAGVKYAVARPPAALDYPLHVLPYSLTIPLLVLAGGGLLLAVARSGRRLIPVWAVLAAYYLILAMDNSRLVRATIPLLPFAALFIALLVVKVGRNAALRVAATAVLGVCVAYAFLFSLAYVQAMGKPDPRIQASQWIIDHVPKGSAIAVSSKSNVDVPQLAVFGYHSVEVGQSVARLQGAPTPYLILSDMSLLPSEEAIAHYPALRAFTAAVSRTYCTVAEFENSQTLLGINAKPRTAALAFDWLYPNPRITILERSPAAGCPSGHRWRWS